MKIIGAMLEEMTQKINSSNVNNVRNRLEAINENFTLVNLMLSE